MSDEKDSVSTIQMQFGKPIIDRLKGYRIPVDTQGTVCLVLMAIFEEKYDLLDVLDDSNKERRAGVLYRQLVLRGLLEPTEPGEKSIYRLTAKGNEFVTFLKEQCKEQFPKNREIAAENVMGIAEMEQNEVDKWIIDYVNLFPMKNAEGRMLRMHEVPAAQKMRPFIKRYKYDKNTILGATALYIYEQERNDPSHKYTKNSTNFVQKYGTGIESELASWCKRYLEYANEPADGFDLRTLDMA